MKRNALMRAAGSALIVAVSMVGCNGAALRTHTATISDKHGADTVRLSALTEKALAKRDAAAATTHAEALVAAVPDNAAYRALLGRAYLAGGRFLSAETAFNDAMTLGNRDARTIISLSMIRSALGKGESARALLTDAMDVLPAADYGLAMAMAGDAGEGVRVLSQAIHDPSADARTRQNLAYAYALAGQWREARMTAEQDLAPVDAGKRVLMWAQLAQPGAEQARVAAFIGIHPVANDAGQPARLALAPTAPVAAMASADLMAAPAVDSSDVAMAPAPAAETAAYTPVEAPMIAAPKAAVKTAALPSDLARETTEQMEPALKRIAWIKPVGPEQAGNWVVQLGAYSAADVAKESWKRIAKSNDAVGLFPVVHSTATVNGRFFHRLAIGGFVDRASADSMCRTIRAQGSDCFVRAGGAEVKASIWAAWKAKGKPMQLAAR